jgi:8-oxo-dGTP pyrophosphatase MutT (NUDIX family)
MIENMKWVCPCVCALVAGEVSLPGGKKEEGDADDVETALREAKEEIGLDPSLVNVVTVLEPFVTKVILVDDHRYYNNDIN